jgi:hypothetical protein
LLLKMAESEAVRFRDNSLPLTLPAVQNTLEVNAPNYFDQRSSGVPANATRLTQANFATETYRITTGGYYILDSDIVFNPSLTSPNKPLGGWFAALTVETTQPWTFDGNGYSISIGDATLDAMNAYGAGQDPLTGVTAANEILGLAQLNPSYLFNPSISLIQLNNTITDNPLLGGLFGFPGPFVSAANGTIRNITLRKTNHFPLFGINNHNITVERVRVQDYQITGIYLPTNVADANIVVKNCEVSGLNNDPATKINKMELNKIRYGSLIFQGLQRIDPAFSATLNPLLPAGLRIPRVGVPGALDVTVADVQNLIWTLRNNALAGIPNRLGLPTHGYTGVNSYGIRVQPVAGNGRFAVPFFPFGPTNRLRGVRIENNFVHDIRVHQQEVVSFDGKVHGKPVINPAIGMAYDWYDYYPAPAKIWAPNDFALAGPVIDYLTVLLSGEANQAFVNEMSPLGTKLEANFFAVIKPRFGFNGDTSHQVGVFGIHTANLDDGVIKNNRVRGLLNNSPRRETLADIGNGAAYNLITDNITYISENQFVTGILTVNSTVTIDNNDVEELLAKDPFLLQGSTESLRLRPATGNETIVNNSWAT